MAIGDVIAAEIGSEGWDIFLTFEGLGPTAGDTAYDASASKYVMGDVHGYDKTVANGYLDIVSEGYTNGVLGTVNRRAVITKVVRLPYPNNNQIDEEVIGADLKVRFALSNYVFDDDRDGGAGTSGTNPTVTLAAGFVAGANPSNAASAFAVVNNSTQDYPKVIAQWDWLAMRGGWRRQETDFEIGCIAHHGYGIDTVALSAIGEGNTNPISANVGQTQRNQAGSGLYYESYRLAIPIAGYTQGDKINLRYIAYPKVGDADSIIDTDQNIDPGDRPRGLTPVDMTCDKTTALRRYAIVDGDVGDNSSGTSSPLLATARGAPYLTIGGAIAGGANIIYVKNSTADVNLLGSNVGNIVAGFYIEVTQDPDDLGAQLTRTGANREYGADFLAYENITFSDSNDYLDGQVANRQLLFWGCTFNNNVSPSAPLCYRSLGGWLLNCNGMGGDKYTSFATSRNCFVMMGCTFSQSGGGDIFYTGIANDWGIVGNGGFAQKAATNAGPDFDNVIYEANRFMNQSVNGTTNGCMYFGANGPMRNFAIIKNLMVATSGNGTVVWIGGDGSAELIENMIYARNTSCGERENKLYNDAGSVSVFRKLCFMYGNATRSFNIKGDKFASSPDGGRLGNWASLWGCEVHDNKYDGSASSEFTGEFLGRRVDFELGGSISSFGEFQYENEQSTDTGIGDLANANYQPKDISILVDNVVEDDFIRFDMFGKPADDTIGAIFEGTAPPVLINFRIRNDGLEAEVIYTSDATAGADGFNGFALTMSGGAVAATYASGDPESTHVYNLSRRIENDETGTVNYTNPGDGVQSLGGGLLADFTNFTVDNDSFVFIVGGGGGGPAPNVTRTLAVRQSIGNLELAKFDEGSTRAAGYAIITDAAESPLAEITFSNPAWPTLSGSDFTVNANPITQDANPTAGDAALIIFYNRDEQEIYRGEVGLEGTDNSGTPWAATIPTNLTIDDQQPLAVSLMSYTAPE